MNSDSTSILTIILICAFIIVAMGMMILWFAMLLDAFRHPNQQTTIWMVILICFGSVGGIIYYFGVYSKRKNQSTISSTEEPVIPPGSYTVNDDKIE